MRAKEPSITDLKDFRDWLQQSIDEGATDYNAHSSGNCLVCQYLTARGAAYVEFQGETTLLRYMHEDAPPVELQLPKAIAKIAYGMSGKLYPQLNQDFTFKAALDRAKKVIEIAKLRAFKPY